MQHSKLISRAFWALLIVAALSPARAAEQASYVTPIIGPMNMGTFANTHVNPALRALATCHNGASAPANGPSSAPLAYQCWVDTTANPSLYKMYDGASWITLGSINTTTHVWSPYFTGGVSGGVPFFSASNVMGSSALLAQYGFMVGGGAGAAPATIAACSDNQIAFGVTSSAPLCRTVTGDISFAAGVAAIGPAKVTSAMMRDSGALSVIGRSANTSGVPADISATAASDAVLRESGSTIGFGTIATGGIANDAVTDAKLRNSGALSVIGRSANTSGDPADISAVAASDCVFRESGSTVGCGTIATAGVADGSITNAKAATMAAHTYKGNNTGSTAAPIDLSIAQVVADLSAVQTTRNISTGCGLAGGGDLSSDRTLRLSLTINAQTGTTYTVLDGDSGKVVSFNNASAVAVTLPQANGSTFISGWSVDFQNKGAGTVTITPTTSTINGGASFALTQNQGMHCDSDGTDYTCVLGVGVAAGSGTVTQVVCGTGLTGGTITVSGTCAVDSSPYIGVVDWVAYTRVPTNYLKADGSSVSRATYASLFAKLIYSSTVTFTNGSADITWTAHGLSAGDPIKLFNSGGALPTNFTASTHGLPTVGTNYCVLAAGLTANVFRVGSTCSGSAITAGSAGSGTHTAVNAPWGDGDGSTTFTLPALMGEFVRNWDGGAGIDSNRQFGLDQLDAMQGHYHSASSSTSSNDLWQGNANNGGSGAFNGVNSIGGITITTTVTAATTDGTNGTPRTATETRPRNNTLMAIIRYQ